MLYRAAQQAQQAQQAGQQTARAGQQGQPQGAEQSMRRAAESLQQAAQSLAPQPGQPGRPNATARQPNDTGAAGGGLPDLSALSPELRKYAGKRWGELPGELRTRIIQDMQAKFGEDYARNI